MYAQMQCSQNTLEKSKFLIDSKEIKHIVCLSIDSIPHNY